MSGRYLIITRYFSRPIIAVKRRVSSFWFCIYLYLFSFSFFWRLCCYSLILLLPPESVCGVISLEQHCHRGSKQFTVGDLLSPQSSQKRFSQFEDDFQEPTVPSITNTKVQKNIFKLLLSILFGIISRITFL